MMKRFLLLTSFLKYYPLFSPLFFIPVPPLSSSPFVTDWGSSPLLARLSLNDSYRFCWVQSSRTWAAWHCPPRLALWRPGGPKPSGCPLSLAHPLWRTWTALWPYWKRETKLWEGFGEENGVTLFKPRFYFTHFIHSSFRHNRQWDTTSTDKFSLDRATSSLFNRVGPGKEDKGGLLAHHMTSIL